MYKMHMCVICLLHSASLKPGFTSREIVILENDDPGGVFEFSAISRGPWTISVRLGYLVLCFKCKPPYLKYISVSINVLLAHLK